MATPSTGKHDAPYGAFNGVSCAQSVACVAVGTRSFLNEGALVERWNGAKWLVDSGLALAGSGLVFSGVACTQTSKCFAVGLQPSPTGSHTLVEMWNGAKWSFVASPNLS